MQEALLQPELNDRLPVRHLNTIKRQSAAVHDILEEVQRAIEQHQEIIFTTAIDLSIIKEDTKHRVALIDSRLLSRKVFVKQYSYSGWKCWLNRWVKSPVARHVFAVGHAFRQRSIPTPTPILFTEDYSRGNYQGMIITESLSQAVTLKDFLIHKLPEMSPTFVRDWLGRYLKAIAQIVGRLHLGHYDHRDLKFTNIMVTSKTQETALWLIDLDAVQCWRLWLPSYRRAQNLARLVVDLISYVRITKATLLKGLKFYLIETYPYAGSIDWKILWKQIANKVSSIQKRKQSSQSSSQLRREVA